MGARQHADPLYSIHTQTTVSQKNWKFIPYTGQTNALSTTEINKGNICIFARMATIKAKGKKQRNYKNTQQ